MSVMDRMSKLITEVDGSMPAEAGAAAEEPALEGDDLLMLAAERLALGLSNSAPDEPQEAADFTVDVLRQLIRKKQYLIKAFRKMGRSGVAGKTLRAIRKEI